MTTITLPPEIEKPLDFLSGYIGTIEGSREALSENDTQIAKIQIIIEENANG